MAINSLVSTRTFWAALTVVVMLLGIEVVVRVRAYSKHGTLAVADEDMYVEDLKIGKVLRPGFQRDGNEEHVYINSLGFRGKEFPVAKPDGVYRIAFLGDSVLFGGETEQDVVTARVQRILNERFGCRFHVINASVPGYKLPTVRRLYKHRVRQLDPDMVVICQVVNDLKIEVRRSLAQAAEA